MLLLANIFQPLIDVFQSIISFFHNSLGISWGWSIVLLTVCVRLVMVPLFIKQFHSMRAMQRHQPELKALQQKYKGDKQRQQQEMMKFYRENNVNPLASCLPMALQLPVFISLFYMLRKNLRVDICPGVQSLFQAQYAHANHVTLAAAKSQTIQCTYYPHIPVPQASFLFIHDITATATGATLVILLVLYVVTQLASTLMMAQPTMDQTQRRIMMFMPLLFVPFILRFPAGLLVYWITTNAWTMGQQFVMRRQIGPPPPAATSTGADVVESASAANGGSRKRAEPSGSGSFRERLLGAAAAAGGRAGAKEANGTGPGKAAGQGAGPQTPPRPPRKKKKRSGRRR